LRLKEAADRGGKPIYLEMSSVNPVLLLNGALRERGEALAEEFFASCTMGAGQFCTNPGLLILPATREGEDFASAACQRFSASQPGVLLGRGVRDSLVHAVALLRESGAEVLCGGNPGPGPAIQFQNTILRVTGDRFLQSPEALQTEAFGPVALLVFSSSKEQTVEILEACEGNLTGTIYSHSDGSDDADYAVFEPVLRRKVGRLLNDKMPTGVAVSPAMNHGGPYPATGHPGFTAVGLPASIRRFAALHSYDAVRPHRLPAWLR
jgi:NADP-dependent aldehyde dehydrogenase